MLRGSAIRAKIPLGSVVEGQTQGLMFGCQSAYRQSEVSSRAPGADDKVEFHVKEYLASLFCNQYETVGD